MLQLSRRDISGRGVSACLRAPWRSTSFTLARTFSTTRADLLSVTAACRCQATAANTTTTTTSATSQGLNAESFLRLTPMVLLQQALAQYTALDGSAVAREMDGGEDVNRILITRETFDAFCAECHVSDADHALALLSEAAVVVALNDGQLVHLRPVQYAEEMESVSALSTSDTPDADALERLHLPRSFIVHQQARRVEELTAQEEAIRTQLQPAIAKAARWRRTVWGGTLVFAGAQLAIISRLTYFDLDWDIMEPVSYMITIGTALFFYVYYLRHDVEHTYEDFDRRYVAKRVRKYAPKDFDWNHYDSVCEQLDMERATLKFLEKWAKSH